VICNIDNSISRCSWSIEFFSYFLALFWTYQSP